MSSCAGAFQALFLYDIAEEIDLAALRKVLPSTPPARSPGFKLPAPDYVRFERPPVVEHCEPVVLGAGATADARLRYFDYGVVSLQLVIQFQGTWDEVIALSNHWMEAGEVEQRALKIVREHVLRLESTLRKPYASWIDEVYYIVELHRVLDREGGLLTGRQVIAGHTREISQVVRGEMLPLSEGEEREILASSMSYYPTDLLVVGWQSAIVYDTPQGAAALIELLEYANTQLLEYRRYDEILTELLTNARITLEHKGGFLSRWTLARAAEQLNRLRLETMELTERTDNAIKFLSDMFYARAYRMAAAKVGVNDYRTLVDRKLLAVGELYEFMVNEFREARSFVLELLVIVILVVELVPIFKGK
jgi:hypothetical protein